jgi:hypothetical protein
MAFFIKLTAVDNRDTFVNADMITHVERHGESTGIYFDHENSISVKETPQQVLASLGPDRWARPVGF